MSLAMTKINVQCQKECPTLELMQVRTRDERNTPVLHQKWRVLQWGNREGYGMPMNVYEEWRPIPEGILS